MTYRRKTPDAHPEAPALGAPRPEPVESTQLLGANHELLIRHGGRTYRLRRTRLGKLILTAS